MKEGFSLAVTGDSIINRRLSVYGDERFLSLVKVLRSADVAYTQFETLIHDYEGPEIYPAAEAGGTWMRSPRFILEELKWMGFDIVSCATNHSMDYSYGGLFSSMKSLDDAGIPYAGVGRNLGEAREPAYLDTEKGRIALISICSTFARWAAASEVRRDVKGRPGINPLNYYFVVPPKILRTLGEIGSKMGLHIIQKDKVWLFIPPGLYNTVYKFVLGEEPEIYHEAEKRDVDGNLRSIKDARRQADYVLVHLHCHEWQPGRRYRPARFVQSFAKACIDAGADVFVQQGAHRGPGGIEVYKRKPIIYEPGDFMSMNSTVTKLPSEFYWNETYVGHGFDLRRWEATPSEAFDARLSSQISRDLTPEVEGSVVAVCKYGDNRRLMSLELHPVVTTRGRSQVGRPVTADKKEAKQIIRYLSEMSSTYGTKVRFKDGVGLVTL